jgi:hypothetical protein
MAGVFGGSSEEKLKGQFFDFVRVKEYRLFGGERI